MAISLRKRFCKLYAVIFLLGICLLSIVDCQETEASQKDYQRLSRLSQSLSFDKIIDEFQQYQWAQLTDPRILMFYVEALVEREKILPPSLSNAAIPEYVRGFAKAYYLLLNGKHADSLETLSRIQRDSWRDIGLLEFAMQTGSTSYMPEPLAHLERIDKEERNVIPWALPYYRAFYSFYIGNFGASEKILEEERSNLDQSFYFEYSTRLLMTYQNRLSEVETRLKNIPNQFVNDPNIILLKGEFIDIKYGSVESAKYLNDMVQKYPNMWILKERSAHALIQAGQAEKGVAILKTVAKQRKFDVLTQLDLFNVALDYEKDKKEITTLAKALDTHQLRTPYFHLVRAKLHQQLNRKERAYKELVAARRLSPYNKEALWMESGFAKLWHDWEKAEDALKKVLEIDPYNVYAMFGLAEVYHAQNDWDSFLKIVKALKNSGGFIDKEEQQKLDVMIRDVPAQNQNKGAT